MGLQPKFTATEPGPHNIQVMFAGQPVPRSPFRVLAVKDAAAFQPVVCDPSKVKAYGPRVDRGQGQHSRKLHDRHARGWAGGAGSDH